MGYYILTILAFIFLNSCIGHSLQQNRNVVFNRLWAGLPAPTIESKQGGVLVTFQRNNVNLKMTDGAQIGTQTTTEKTPKSSPKRTPKSSLKSSPKSSPKTRDVIVELMRTNPIVTIAEIATIVHTSERNVKKHTKNLQDEGFIRRIDGKNGGHWGVIE